jgi:hypothetical protein
MNMNTNALNLIIVSEIAPHVKKVNAFVLQG